MTSTVTEREPRAIAADDTCEATIPLFNITCGEPAVGQFTGICVHEHVRTGPLCRDHAGSPEAGLCRACYVLPDGLAHECRITLVEVTP